MIFQPGFGEHFSGSFVPMQCVLYDFIASFQNERALTLKNLTV